MALLERGGDPNWSFGAWSARPTHQSHWRSPPRSLSAKAPKASFPGRIADGVHDHAAGRIRGIQCRLCGEQELGDAYALANQPDSAVAVYERYLDPVCSIVSIQTVLISGRFSSGLERSTRVVATWIGPSRYTPVSPIYGRTLTKCSSRVFVTRVHL